MGLEIQPWTKCQSHIFEGYVHLVSEMVLNLYLFGSKLQPWTKYLAKSKLIKQNLTTSKTFDICFSLIFERCC